MMTACQERGQLAQETVAEEEETTVLVRIDTISTTMIDQSIQYSGTLLPNKEIYFAPALPGRIDKIYVDIGSRVKTGQVLIEMDKTQLSQAITQLNSATDTYERISSLYETGSIAEQQFEQAKTQVELAQMNVDLLQKNMDFKSPISGIITGKYFENGELYSGAPNTQAGKAAVVTIQQINPIKVMVSISQSYYPRIKHGMTAAFTTDIYPGKNFAGKVSRVFPYIDPMTRTFKVEFLIVNNNEMLKPGMSVDMTLTLTSGDGLLLPSIAVLNQSGTNNRYIFINDNGVAKRIDVEVLKRHNGMLEISSPEQLVGKQLIVEGQAKLLNGTRIEVVSN
jgi:RND family efflux transporter MFP subunit